MRLATGAGVLSLACALAGCAEDSPRDLRWQISFAPGVDAEGARGIEASILAGGCTGEPQYVARARVGVAFDTRPDVLDPGTYGFAARAMDRNCEFFAEGCTSVVLPRADAAVVSVRLFAVDTPVAGCRSVDCDDGLCRVADAGVPDAGDDASVGLDATAGADAGLDAGPPPDGGVVCADPLTADCNGLPGDGCERDLTTLTDCGQCDVACGLFHADATCATGTCEVDGCDPGWEDCNDEPEDGCEAIIGSIDHCAVCYDSCLLSRAQVDCQAGQCVFVGCSAHSEDCDGNPANGCNDLWEDEGNCGSCGNPCLGGLECHKGNCE